MHRVIQASMGAMAKRLFIVGSLMSIDIVQGRILTLYSSDDELTSDGIEKQEWSTRSTCNHLYGFLPCAENAAGYIFQIVVYQVLMVVGGRLITRGSNVLLHIIGAEKHGGIVFRILMAVPSMMLMIISGLFSSKEDAEAQVSVGVGVYTGITVFSLTIQWGVCLIYGKIDLKTKAGQQTSNSCTISRIFRDTGVKIDKKTCYTAGIVLLSLIPYAVLQLVYVFNTYSGKHFVTLIALIVSSLSLISYVFYQILDPWMQERSVQYSNVELLKATSLITEKGEPNTDLIKELFRKFDANKDKKLSLHELKEMITRLTFKENEVFKEIVSEFDLSGNYIAELDFVRGVKKYLDKVIQAANTSGVDGTKNTEEFEKSMWEAAGYGMWDLLRSVVQVFSGVAILTFLGKPLTSDILELSHAMGFSSFIISFFVVPLTMNARSAIAAILPASKKSQETASWTFSEIYGGVIMNNMAGLTTLLAIVYARELAWGFSAEVLTILVVCATIGTLAFFRTTYHLWTCILAFLLYPFSLAFFYFLQLFLTRNSPL